VLQYQAAALIGFSPVHFKSPTVHFKKSRFEPLNIFCCINPAHFYVINKSTMKKIIFLFSSITILSATAIAQNNIGIGTNAPHASALLDITSTTKGLLIPRMTTADRTALAAPAKGLMVFDNETNSFWYYNGSEWSSLSGSNGLSLPYQQSVASNTYIFDITNSGTGGALSGALKGVSTSVGGVGVYGLANSTGGAGLKGESNQGIGVYGYSGTKQAIYGSAISGTALYGTSAAGYALETVGNIKISGGNTNPTNGAVLTSDANGNATWKPQPKVAFDVSNSPTSIPDGATVNIAFTNQNYDAGGNYNLAGAASNPNAFVAPVAGYYHFDLSFVMNLQSLTTNIGTAIATLSKNGIDFYIMQSFGHSSAINSKAPFSESTGIHLNAGDVIRATAYQTNATSLTATIQTASFSGHLVFAD